MQMVAFGDLIGPGLYKVHSRFDRVANFTDGMAVVSVAEKSVGVGPVNVTVNRLNGLENDGVLEVCEDRITIGRYVFEKEKKKEYDSGIPFDKKNAAIFFKSLRLYRKVLESLASSESLVFLLNSSKKPRSKYGFEQALARQFREGMELLVNGFWKKGTLKIRGLGVGLTPSGDDFLTGFIIGCHILEKIKGRMFGLMRKKIYKTAIGGNLLSNTFLSCAERGRCFEKFGNLIRSLSTGNQKLISDRVKLMIQLGETSGADTSVGFLSAMKMGGLSWS